MSTALSELKVTELKSTDIALVAADAAIVTISSVDLWAPPKLVPATTESALFNLKVPAGPDINDAPPGGITTSSTEVAAFVIIDTMVRLIPGVLGNPNSLSEESFEGNLLEYPQYTKPQKWEGKEPPNVLLTGDHAKIKDWRLTQSEDITRRRRPDLWKKYKKKEKWKILEK